MDAAAGHPGMLDLSWLSSGRLLIGVEQIRQGWPLRRYTLDLASVGVLARWTTHRLRLVLGVDGVDSSDLHAGAHQLDEVVEIARTPATPTTGTETESVEYVCTN